MKTLTICGSMRFEEQMKKIAFKLETEYGSMFCSAHTVRKIQRYQKNKKKT